MDTWLSGGRVANVEMISYSSRGRNSSGLGRVVCSGGVDSILQF
jgi:hypothetical protein